MTEKTSKFGKDLPKRLLKYFFGLFIMTAGISLSVISDLGVSPLSTIPYAVTLYCGFDMGLGTTIMHAFFVLMQIVLLRKNFRPFMLLQVPAGIVFGWFTSLCNGWADMIPKTDNFVIQLLLQLGSILLVAIGIHFYLPANIIPLAGEGIVSAISSVFHWSFPKVKVGFDISAVILSAAFCLIMLGSLGSVGIGTLLSALLTGTVLAYIEKLLLIFRKKKKTE